MARANPPIRLLQIALFLIFILQTTDGGTATAPESGNFSVYFPAYSFSGVGTYYGLLQTDKDAKVVTRSVSCGLGGVSTDECACGEFDDKWTIDQYGGMVCYDSIPAPGGNFHVKIRCPNGEFAENVRPDFDLYEMYTCALAETEHDDCLDCNEGGDPFVIQNGDQIQRFDDIFSNGSFGLFRTYSTKELKPAITTVQSLNERKAVPAGDYIYTPFGAGWSWEYGIYLTTKVRKYGRTVYLHDSDGRTKVFNLSGSAWPTIGSKYDNYQGQGTIEIIHEHFPAIDWENSGLIRSLDPDDLSGPRMRLRRPNGDMLYFTKVRNPDTTYTDPGTDTWYWRLDYVVTGKLPRKTISLIYNGSRFAGEVPDGNPFEVMYVKSVSDGRWIMNVSWTDCQNFGCDPDSRITGITLGDRH